jgi:hypothetical protein
MTEAEWLNCSNPENMLEFLHGRTSDRKLRLFAIACCRRIEHLLAREPIRWGRKAVEVWERFLEGQASRQDLDLIHDGVRGDALDAGHYIAHPAEVDAYAVSLAADATVGIRNGTSAACAAMAIAYEELAQQIDAPATRLLLDWGRAQQALEAVDDASTHTWQTVEDAITQTPVFRAARDAESAIQSRLLRCIIGNPFHPVALHPAWLHWHDGAAVHMAQAIDRERRYQDLPILADALEEAGCTDSDLLGHCRSSEEHVRGCWVVDALLAKA